MISTYFIFLLSLSLLVSLPIIILILRTVFVTSGVVIDPDFTSWTCYRCWVQIKGQNRDILTSNVCSHLRMEHTFLGRILYSNSEQTEIQGILDR